jgi:hypothetical protein
LRGINQRCIGNDGSKGFSYGRLVVLEKMPNRSGHLEDSQKLDGKALHCQQSEGRRCAAVLTAFFLALFLGRGGGPHYVQWHDVEKPCSWTVSVEGVKCSS